jgi:hypothetical protein
MRMLCLKMALLAICAVVGAHSPAHAKPKSAFAPKAIVEWIYATAIKPEKGEKSPRGGEFLFEANELKASFSGGFGEIHTRAYSNANEDADGPVVGFDPVTNSQDPDFTRYVVEVETQDASHAIVAAKMWARKARTPTIVRYDFVKENEAWKIDDIRSAVEKEPWSLRELLKLNTKP